MAAVRVAATSHRRKKCAAHISLLPSVVCTAWKKCHLKSIAEQTIGIQIRMQYTMENTQTAATKAAVATKPLKKQQREWLSAQVAGLAGRERTKCCWPCGRTIN